MSSSTAPNPPAAASPSSPARLAGPWRQIAPAAWLLITLLSVAAALAGVPAQLAQLSLPCTPPACRAQQLSAEAAASLLAVGVTPAAYAAFVVALELGAALVWLACAVVLVWRRPVELMGLFTAVMLVAFGVGFSRPALALADSGAAWPAAVALLNLVGLATVVFFFFLFPNGRLAPPWARPAAAVALGITLLLALSPALDPRRSAPGFLLLIGLLALGLAAQVARYRRHSSPAERLQTRWVLFGMLATVVGYGAVIVADLFVGAAGPYRGQILLAEHLAFALVSLAMPLTIGVAVLRYRLWAIDPLVNRALLYGALSATTVGLYLLIVGALGALLGAADSPLLPLAAVIVVATVAQPLRAALQRRVNRLLYGDRDEPYQLLTRLGQRLEGTLSPEEALASMAQTLCDALKLPYAAISVDQGDLPALLVAAGEPVADVSTLPLSYQGVSVGALTLGARGPGEAWNPADQRLFADLARQIGVAAHAVRLHTTTARLAEELQQARAQLVAAREEERRRLRRDLHDSLGASLALLAIQIDSARDMVDGQPAEARELLAEATASAQSTIADVRRLVHNLRPPALDELGLDGALRAQAVALLQNRTQLTLDAPEPLPPLPAAVEVAAYRIAQEALTNVVRHAQARHCWVWLSVGDGLELLVCDDGVGLRPERRAGVGLSSMVERARELGGSCVVELNEPRGTRVRAWLPLHGGRERGA
jgi:signal transduction histidine kinase